MDRHASLAMTKREARDDGVWYLCNYSLPKTKAMTHLLNLLAAIALLVWGTLLVRTDILRVLGASLRKVLAQSVSNRFKAALSGIGVTALLQSSTATALII